MLSKFLFVPLIIFVIDCVISELIEVDCWYSKFLFVLLIISVIACEFSELFEVDCGYSKFLFVPLIISVILYNISSFVFLVSSVLISSSVKFSV